MALTLSVVDTHVNRGIRHKWYDVTFDSSYATGGESLTASDIGMNKINFLEATSQGGYLFEYDYSASKLLAFRSGGFTPAGTISGGGTAGTIIDSDAAAATGVALYVHIDEVAESGNFVGHLEAVTAGNANSYFAISNGGPIVRVKDDDAAASGGLQLFFDEDAAATDSRFLADLDLPGDIDLFIATSTGEFIRIKDDDSAGTNGVALYFDDDAANDYEKVLFVSPTDANGSFTTDDTVGQNFSTLSFSGNAVSEAVLNEVDSATNLASITTRIYANGV